MSSAGFDILRHKHEAWGTVISNLEAEMANTLKRDPNAIIDGEILTQQLNVESRKIFTLLLELVAQHELHRLYLWLCPKGEGTAMESTDLQSFPEWIECDRCSDIHYFNQDDIEIHFLPSDSLKNQLLAQR
jgi:hypothetical protein